MDATAKAPNNVLEKFINPAAEAVSSGLTLASAMPEDEIKKKLYLFYRVTLL
jgi:hypothetical protein